MFGCFVPAVVGGCFGFFKLCGFLGREPGVLGEEEQLPRFPSWHISCQEHHGYNRGTCVVQPWCNRGTLWAQLWHNCGTGVVQPGVQPRHMWTHHGTTGTLRAHRGTPGSSVKLDSVIQSYDLDQPKGKCDRSQYASRGFQNISN